MCENRIDVFPTASPIPLLATFSEICKNLFVYFYFLHPPEFFGFGLDEKRRNCADSDRFDQPVGIACRAPFLSNLGENEYGYASFLPFMPFTGR